MIERLLIAATPLMFASLGALFTELAGVLGIFIEGFMNMGAFFTYFFLVKTSSVLVSCLLVAIGGACIGYLLARFVNISKANPFIVGLALNLASGGLTNSLSAVWFGTKGVLRNTGVLMPTLFSMPIFVYAAGACFVLAAISIHRTRFGLRLRACGFSPQAAIERGIYTNRYQEAAWAIAGLLAAIAGACLTMRVGAYTPGGAAGRGWIALAAVYLGFRTIWGTALAALVFAFVEHVGISLQGLSSLPATALLGIPSALALIFYTVSCVIRNKSPLS